MIKRLEIFDFDGTLFDSPMPEDGKKIWKQKKGEDYPHKGWWGKKESLDLEVFDIKPFKKVLNKLNSEKSKGNTDVIILTSRLGSLRPQLEEILNKNEVKVDKLDMRDSNKSKGDKILEYIKEYPNVNAISVYDDRECEIDSYKEILPEIPNNITFKIYFVHENNVDLFLEKNNIKDIVSEEVELFLKNIKK